MTIILLYIRKSVSLYIELTNKKKTVSYPPLKECVAEKMGKLPCSMLSETNHKENAWLKYKQDSKLFVPFDEAFSLKAF